MEVSDGLANGFLVRPYRLCVESTVFFEMGYRPFARAPFSANGAQKEAD
jgi:hypothetical protein